MIKLIAVDALGRQQAEVTFKRTRRWNDARDVWEWGYNLITAEGCDFGSAKFFFSLPSGTAGMSNELATWEPAEVTDAEMCAADVHRCPDGVMRPNSASFDCLACEAE